MSDAFRCDRCKKYSEGVRRVLDMSAKRHEYYVADEDHWSADLCESCARDAKRWVSEPPPQAALPPLKSDPELLR